VIALAARIAKLVHEIIEIPFMQPRNDLVIWQQRPPEAAPFPETADVATRLSVRRTVLAAIPAVRACCLASFANTVP
jgi:hypothetical protein